MGFLDDFKAKLRGEHQRQPSPRAAGAGARPVKPGQPSRPATPKPAVKVPGATSGASKPYEEPKLGTRSNPIMLRDNIPAFERVLSGVANSEFTVSDEFKLDIAILLTNEDKRTVEIIISARMNKPQVVADINERVKKAGYRTAPPLYVDHGIIGLIYDESAKSGADTTAKEASEMQRLFDDLLIKAVSVNASDIHIESRRNSAIVRFRADGSLLKVHDWSPSQASQLASVIYNVVAEEKDVTFQSDRPQDAVAERDIRIGDGMQRIRARIATMPAYPAGFDMVMRILRMGSQSSATTSKKADLGALGYLPEQVHDIDLSIARPVGVTVMAGVTGSGKSTSLTTMLRKKIQDYEGRIKVITVEDPPEYVVEGATQSPVVRSKSSKSADGEKVNPFAASIRAAMRSDPDVIMVGEVRDEESAKLLVSATQSGHQVFTTVHAPSAFGIIGRLRSLGVPNDVLGSLDFISGLIYQTLCPVLCPECSVPLEQYMAREQSERAEQLKMRLVRVVENLAEANVRFRNPESTCEHCKGKGIIGRTVVAEVVLPDENMKILFSGGKDTEALRYWKTKKNGKTVLWYGIGKMKQGLLDPFDVEHKMGLLDSEVATVHEETNFEEARRGVLEQGRMHTPPLAVAQYREADVLEDEGFDSGRKQLTVLDDASLADLTSFGAAPRSSAVIEPFVRRASGTPTSSFNEFASDDDSDIVT